MDYKYPPIVKYVLLYVLIYFFFEFQNMMPLEKNLIITFIILCMVIVLDYLLIRDHTYMFRGLKNPLDGTDDNDTDTDISEEEVEEILEEIESESESESMNESDYY